MKFDQKLLKSKLNIKDNLINTLLSKLTNVKDGEDIAVAFWNSPKVYMTIKTKYPKCNVYYIEDGLLACAMGVNNAIAVNFEKGEYFPNMKFDKIIMNPPYNKTLHLKVLREAINHRNGDGIIVNLSPVRWLCDPFWEMKRSTLKQFIDVASSINSIDIIDKTIANESFGIELFSDLGLYTVSNSVNKLDYKNYWKQFRSVNDLSIINKLLLHNTSLNDKIERDVKDGIRVLIAEIAGNRGSLPIYKDLDYAVDGLRDGVDWTKLKNNGGYPKQEGIALPLSIKFSSIDEAINFYNSIMTTFYKYVANTTVQQQHIQLNILPFMSDYTQPWTNERFCKHFGITGFISDTEAEPNSEWETILTAMENL